MPTYAGVMVDRKERSRHWDTTYETKTGTGVSWYQPVPQVSLELIGRMDIGTDTPVIDVGGGESTLVDHLEAAGFKDLTVLDVSEVALNDGRSRLGQTQVRRVEADVLAWQPDRRYGLWHDRAVFHFLVEASDRTAYVKALQAATMVGSAVVVGTFAPDGPESCSGLPVVRYSAGELTKALGQRFEVMATREENHRTPGGGVQPFTWVAGRIT
jgi:hypothetical protein